MYRDCLPKTAWPPTCGRFGYTESVDIPGFLVERKGFKVRQDQADWFGFEMPSKIWKPVATDEFSQTVQLTGAGLSPEKARFDLLGAGFSLYFRHGIGLKLTSIQAPYLGWDEGSVGPGVPTPNLQWVLVSFRDSQPPLLLAVQGPKEAFRISGKPGDWRLRSATPYQGWVRVTAPLGLRPFATNTASSLGALTLQVKPLLKYLMDPIPKLLGAEYVDEPTAVTVSLWAAGARLRTSRVHHVIRAGTGASVSGGELVRRAELRPQPAGAAQIREPVRLPKGRYDLELRVAVHSGSVHFSRTVDVTEDGPIVLPLAR